jgi:hypothetical protein
VTCERDDGQFAGKNVWGWGPQFNMPEFHHTAAKRDLLRSHKRGRIVTTHDVIQINTGDSYRKHRCYKLKNRECVCECLGTHDFPGQGDHQSGTPQGNAAAIPLDANNLLYSNVPGMDHSIGETNDGHQGPMANQAYFEHAKSIFRQDGKLSTPTGPAKVFGSKGGLMYRHGTAPWSNQGEEKTGRVNTPYGKVYFDDYADRDV